MTRVFRITEEQLESLVADVCDTNAANIIKTAVLCQGFDNNPNILPQDWGHNGEQIAGLKRIYRWLNWEMSSWDNHHSEMQTAFNAIGKAVIAYDNTANLDETENW